MQAVLADSRALDTRTDFIPPPCSINSLSLSGRSVRQSLFRETTVILVLLLRSCLYSWLQVPMLHHPLEDIVLRLKRLGIDKVSRFPFPSPPTWTNLKVGKPGNTWIVMIWFLHGTCAIDVI